MLCCDEKQTWFTDPQLIEVQSADSTASPLVGARLYIGASERLCAYSASNWGARLNYSGFRPYE